MMYNLYIMKISGLLEENQANIRTQISLTSPLKKTLEAKRRLLGESLSEYLRKAAVLRILAEEEEEAELKVLASVFVRPRPWSAKHPNWKDLKAVKKWREKIRSQWQ